METDSVWPVIAGTVSPTRAMHSHTHTGTHCCCLRIHTHPDGPDRLVFCLLALEKISVRLHNEADLCFLFFPHVNAQLSGVEMSEFISNSPGRAELCLCVYSGRKLI